MLEKKTKLSKFKKCLKQSVCTTLDLIPNYSMHALRDTQGKFKGIVLFGLEYQVLVHSP